MSFIAYEDFASVIDYGRKLIPTPCSFFTFIGEIEVMTNAPGDFPLYISFMNCSGVFASLNLCVSILAFSLIGVFI